MKIAAALFGLMLLASTPPAHSKTYLASIGSIKLSPGEGIWSFKLKSWGVEYLAPQAAWGRAGGLRARQGMERRWFVPVTANGCATSF